MRFALRSLFLWFCMLLILIYDVVVHRIVTLVPEKKSMPSTKQEEVITLMLNINAMIATYGAYIEVVGYSSHILYSLPVLLFV